MASQILSSGNLAEISKWACNVRLINDCKNTRTKITASGAYFLIQKLTLIFFLYGNQLIFQILLVWRILREQTSYISATSLFISCQNFWGEDWWFLSLRVFRLLSSSLLLFPQPFGWYVLRPSSGFCRTREPSRNFELRPSLNPWWSPVLIPLAITGYKCQVFLYCYSPARHIA